MDHPTQIGPYRIQQVIGEGGMGTVYKAEQTAPIRRTVAVKVVKLGMDTREVIARFETERQALAMMSHSNVAKVLDAGATESGRPYFVMEFVAGEPITAYADRYKLTLRQRLELFSQACDAVQHAHQKAIIHRDLKPSNILVATEGDKPVVKVIDFGVAKAVSQRLTDKTLFTATGQLVGTPEYMAPEQAEASIHLDNDTRCDVYSLGVVLYELLTGALPFDAKTLRSAGYNEIQRIIKEVDPPRPSTRLSRLGREAGEIARLRRSSLESLSRELRGELEWIPLKAMRKERGQRYSSAAELAEDIHNYLSNLPLRAGPESRAYRARKFFRRNWRAVVASAIMLGLLISGIAATTVQAIRATRAERLAVQQRSEAEAQRKAAVQASENLREVNRFLTEDLLASAAPDVTRGRELTVREAVDRAAGNVAERFRARPLSESAVRLALAETYHALGHSETGLGHAQAAVDILRREQGPDHRDTLSAVQTLGRMLSGVSRYSDAEAVLRPAYERSKQLFGLDHDLTLHCLNELAISIRRQRRFSEAEPLYRTMFDAILRVYGPDGDEAAAAHNGMALVLSEMDRDDKALPYLLRSVELSRRMGTDNTGYLTNLANYGKMLQRLGQIDEAEAATREALAGRRKVQKDDHPQTLISMNDLSWILAEQGEFNEAEALARECLERRRRTMGEDHRDTLQSMNGYGRILTMMGRYEEAEQMLKDTVERRRRVLGEKHAHTIGSTTHLVTVYEQQQRWAEAEPLLAYICRPELISALGAREQNTAYGRWGICLLRLHRYQQAEPILLETLKRNESQQSADFSLAQRINMALADLYDATNRPGDASRYRNAAGPASQPSATQPASLAPPSPR